MIPYINSFPLLTEKNIQQKNTCLTSVLQFKTSVLQLGGLIKRKKSFGLRNACKIL